MFLDDIVGGIAGAVCGMRYYEEVVRVVSGKLSCFAPIVADDDLYWC